ncbi:MAG: putative CRISPR-associated protein Cas4 [Candidatus Thorarchaeota archaeon]|nr:MAG: putative CRISPR-associated protein Cas4 [Candidatus Thorarchaeota archaeon]
MLKKVERKQDAQITPIFSPEDIRQFVYCKRIIFFRYVVRSIPKISEKMKYGSRKHDEWKSRQIRRGEEKDRFFGMYYNNEGLGLFGLLDAIDFDGKKATPVEYKTGKGYVKEAPLHHKAQAMAECLLVESIRNVIVENALLVYKSSKSKISLDYGEAEREWILNVLEEMRKVVVEEIIPPPTDKYGKCVDCEYFPFCRPDTE